MVWRYRIVVILELSRESSSAGTADRPQHREFFSSAKAKMSQGNSNDGFLSQPIQ
jgi:hypothetical protein